MFFRHKIKYFKCSAMHIIRKMATSGLSNSTKNKLEINLDILNLNIKNTIIERSDGVTIVVERAYKLAGDDKDALKILYLCLNFKKLNSYLLSLTTEYNQYFYHQIFIMQPFSVIIIQ